jgi:hypothetical protein
MSTMKKEDWEKACSYHTEVRNGFQKVLDAMVSKVTVRLLRPSTEQLETLSEEYSKVKERSQSKHKPRGLVDA